MKKTNFDNVFQLCFQELIDGLISRVNSVCDCFSRKMYKESKWQNIWVSPSSDLLAILPIRPVYWWWSFNSLSLKLLNLIPAEIWISSTIFLWLEGVFQRSQFRILGYRLLCSFVVYLYTSSAVIFTFHSELSLITSLHFALSWTNFTALISIEPLFVEYRWATVEQLWRSGAMFVIQKEQHI